MKRLLLPLPPAFETPVALIPAAATLSQALLAVAGFPAAPSIAAREMTFSFQLFDEGPVHRGIAISRCHAAPSLGIEPLAFRTLDAFPCPIIKRVPLRALIRRGNSEGNK